VPLGGEGRNDGCVGASVLRDSPGEGVDEVHSEGV